MLYWLVPGRGERPHWGVEKRPFHPVPVPTTKGSVMRHAYLSLAFLFMTGCLYGTGRASTTTSYVHDDGIHPVQRTSVSQTSSGTVIGASVPLMVGGDLGMMGYGYGY